MEIHELPALVLVHGNAHAADWWDLTVGRSTVSTVTSGSSRWIFVAVKQQRASIEAIGGVQTLIEIDTCRGLLVSEPERLAEILVDRCRLHSR